MSDLIQLHTEHSDCNEDGRLPGWGLKRQLKTLSSGLSLEWPAASAVPGTHLTVVAVVLKDFGEIICYTDNFNLKHSELSTD